MQDLFVEKPGFIEVSTSVDSLESAVNMGRILLEKKLAACVQIINEAKSIYWWKDEIRESVEYLLLIKTKMNVYGKLAAELKILHPYDIPEIIVKPIIEGSTQYLNWINENTAE